MITHTIIAVKFRFLENSGGVKYDRKATAVEKVKNQSTKQSAQVIFGVKVYDKQAKDQYKILKDPQR